MIKPPRLFSFPLLEEISEKIDTIFLDKNSNDIPYEIKK
jgi:hypothetical protein